MTEKIVDLGTVEVDIEKNVGLEKPDFSWPETSHTYSVFFYGSTAEPGVIYKKTYDFSNKVKNIISANASVTEMDDYRLPKIGYAIFETLSVNFSFNPPLVRIVFKHDWESDLPFGIGITIHGVL